MAPSTGACGCSSAALSQRWRVLVLAAVALTPGSLAEAKSKKRGHHTTKVDWKKEKEMSRSLQGAVEFNYTNVSDPMTADEEQAYDDLELFKRDGGKTVTLLAGILLLAFLLGNFLHIRHISWFPESMIFVFLGAAIGLILPMGDIETTTGWAIRHITIQEESAVNEMILNWFLLPMIIFEAGWSLKHRDFISQFPYILLFAIFGTLISMGVVGGLILATAGWHGVDQPRVAYTYAALISAVDPVATLATYGNLNVDALLITVVFGESVINDAVAIVLFKTLNKMPAGAYDNMSGIELVSELSSGILQLLTGSLGLGVALGLFYILVIRFARIGRTTSLCALFILFSCFFTYNLAESVVHQSGIIAVLFCGMVMGGWATPHMTSEGAMFTSFLLKQSASVGDLIVFLFVGIAAVYVTGNGLYLGLFVTGFCIVGRAFSTVPLGVLSNCIKRRVHRKRSDHHKHLFTWQHIVMMWHAGLRGGIALVLTLELGDWVDDIDGVGTKESLRNATLVVICLFMAVFGGSTKFMLNALGIPCGGSTKLEHHQGKFQNCMTKLKEDILIPVLVGEVSHDEEDGQGNQVAEVLVEAATVESPLQRYPSKGTVTRWAERYQLFGTYDPTHRDEVNNIRPRRRAGSDGNISDGHIPLTVQGVQSVPLVQGGADATEEEASSSEGASSE